LVDPHAALLRFALVSTNQEISFESEEILV